MWKLLIEIGHRTHCIHLHAVVEILTTTILKRGRKIDLGKVELTRLLSEWPVHRSCIDFMHFRTTQQLLTDIDYVYRIAVGLGIGIRSELTIEFKN